MTADTLREQVSACDVLLASLEADRRATLEALFNVLQGSGFCHSCGSEAILRLGINRDDTLPVPVLDVRDPGDDRWAGLHGRFLAGHAPDRYCGHFIARNYACFVTEGFTREEFLESAKEHETVHILQAMSGRDSELMTRDEMALCKGHVGLLPTLASQRKLSHEHALDLAGRWFLQKLKGELEAWQTIDYPRAAQKAEEGKLDLDQWRKGALAVMVRQFLRPVCGAFLGTYGLSWGELLASVRSRLEALLAGTFLAPPLLADAIDRIKTRFGHDSLHHGTTLDRPKDEPPKSHDPIPGGKGRREGGSSD